MDNQITERVVKVRERETSRCYENPKKEERMEDAHGVSGIYTKS